MVKTISINSFYYSCRLFSLERSRRFCASLLLRRYRGVITIDKSCTLTVNFSSQSNPSTTKITPNNTDVFTKYFLFQILLKFTTLIENRNKSVYYTLLDFARYAVYCSFKGCNTLFHASPKPHIWFLTCYFSSSYEV